MSGSGLYLGTLRHRRLVAPERRFSYRVWHALLDLDQLDELAARIPILSHNRFNLFGFDDRDHLGSGAAPVRTKLAGWLEEQGLQLGASDRVQVLTGLRLLGRAFDPLRLYWWCSAAGQVRAVVAEVTSTFGEGFAYLLPAAGGRVVRAEADKRFHVSPFLADHGSYRFRITPPGERLAVHIDLLQGGQRVFDATLSGRRVPLTSATLLTGLLRAAGGGARTLLRIHVEALRLWLAGAAVVPKPAPPPTAWRTRNG